MKMKYENIKEYAIIGNGRSAALISRNGSLDWLCWPRFDSSSIFGALLDNQRGGYWSIIPCCPYTVKREYLKNSMVLKTTFTCETGSAILIDCMPIFDESENYIVPEQQIIRLIEVIDGNVSFKIIFKPSPGYGKANLKCIRNSFGRAFIWKGKCLYYRSHIEIDDNGIGYVSLGRGQFACMNLFFVKDTPAVFQPLGDFQKQIISDTVEHWCKWAQGCTFEGAYRFAVIRSALVLKSLIYSPSGAIIAAPTTSLPESMGRELNWDYRYCWLRDASLTVRALFEIGFKDEARAFASWLLHTTRISRPKLKAYYDVYGGINNRETVAYWLTGYNGSSPVRIGNAAQEQYQLDIYGEVIDAVGHIIEADRKVDSETENMLINFGLYICRHWNDPDEGIWEPRTGVSQHTHSKVNCWNGINRLLRLQQQKLIRAEQMDLFLKHLPIIMNAVKQKGWSDTQASYVQKFGSPSLDMSLILMPWHGFEDPGSDRMRKTFSALKKRLHTGNCLFYRNDQSRIEKEGAFGICCFWVADYLARGGGSLEQACQQFEGVLSYANDLGLFAEEIEPLSGNFLGNFPQAFTHVGLINAAVSIEKRKKEGY